MDQLKKALGFVWILLGIAAAYFSITALGLPKILSDKQEDNVFGIIILFILTPIITGGLLIFGWYSITGEYDTIKDEATL